MPQAKLNFRYFRAPILAQKIHGFTLLELLVVIAIITMLSSILLPALSKAREKGRQTVCISNLKEIFLAIEMYKNDNDGWYPLARDDSMGTSGGGMSGWYPCILWSGSQSAEGEEVDFTGSPIYPYLKAGEIKTCPSFKKFVKEGAYYAASGGYGYNSRFVGGYRNQDGTYKYKQHKDSDIDNPSQTLILSDSATIVSGGTIGEYATLSTPYYYSSSTGSWKKSSLPRTHFRHNGLANIVWCDGHITSEPMSYSRIGYGKDYPSANIGWIGEDSNEAAIANALYGHHEP